MKNFKPYVSKLADLFEQSSDRRRLLHIDSINAALNGEPSRMLRELVDIDTRRKYGAFFSGSLLGECLTNRWTNHIAENSIICDPACGGGDLLISIAKLLPIKVGLKDTLEAWGRNLIGIDVHKEFVESTKLRLALQAITSGAIRQKINQVDVMQYFPCIRTGDGLIAVEELAKSTHIVTNPPFSYTQSPPNCTWTSGIVNSAALFMDSITMHASAGTRIWAILPDVLRSGTRYEKWRQLVSARLREIYTTRIGQFSKHADVDVYILEGIIRSNHKGNTANHKSSVSVSIRVSDKVLSDKFMVNVGAVVPHRHPNIGPQVPYLTPHNCPPWSIVKQINDYRCFTGTLYKPPFVVVRRTSRSDGSSRAIGTLVKDKREIAVENHLLILKPKSGKISDCKKLIQVLKSNTTNDWLNNRICCRHLTVSAVKSIPWNMET